MTTPTEKTAASPKHAEALQLAQSLTFLRDAIALGTLRAWAIGEGDEGEDPGKPDETCAVVLKDAHGTEHNFSDETLRGALAKALHFLTSDHPTTAPPPAGDVLSTDPNDPTLFPEQ